MTSNGGDFDDFLLVTQTKNTRPLISLTPEIQNAPSQPSDVPARSHEIIELDAWILSTLKNFILPVR